ncbi:MAG: DUF2695 domain-containing protein [Clostridia bacterium]|nr:DUF2695 domain-containing protein [Clostridia bacterium]
MADLSKAKKKTLVQNWEADQRKGYILTEENVQELFEYLEEQLDASCCNHTLHHTEQWLKDNISKEMIQHVIAEITDMGGYCDCEVLLNCYEDYDIG